MKDHPGRHLIGLAVLGALMWASEARPADYYVATAGNDSADGSLQSPWRSLEFALTKSPAGAGDRIVVTPGVYRGLVECTRGGEAGRPLRVVSSEWRQATLAGQLNIFAPYVWLEGLDIRPAGGEADDVALVNMVQCDCKLINCIVHDRRATGVVVLGDDCEVYGCLIYGNGSQKPDRNHGHGIYLSGAPRAIIENNILFDNSFANIHGFNSQSESPDVTLRGNISFLARQGPEVLIWDGFPCCTIEGNVLYSDWKEIPNVTLDFRGRDNGGGVIRDNTVLCGNPDAVEVKKKPIGVQVREGVPWGPRLTGNRVYGFRGSVYLAANSSPLASMVVDNNLYGPEPARFWYGQQEHNLDSWKQLGLEPHGAQGWHPGTEVFAFPNKHDAHLLYIAVYQPGEVGPVVVRSGAIPAGARFVVEDVTRQGQVCAQGVYNPVDGMALPEPPPGTGSFSAYTVQLNANDGGMAR